MLHCDWYFLLGLCFVPDLAATELDCGTLAGGPGGRSPTVRRLTLPPLDSNLLVAKMLGIPRLHTLNCSTIVELNPNIMDSVERWNIVLCPGSSVTFDALSICRQPSDELDE